MQQQEFVSFSGKNINDEVAIVFFLLLCCCYPWQVEIRTSGPEKVTVLLLAAAVGETLFGKEDKKTAILGIERPEVVNKSHSSNKNKSFVTAW